MKPRKMLGDINSETCKALMNLIGSQSLETLVTWSAEYVGERMLPIAARYCESTEPLASALKCAYTSAERACDAGKSAAKLLTAEDKAALNAARDFARDVTDPIGQAAARAVATAAAVVRTPTNALGFLFYAAAASAYDSLGLDSTREAQDSAAQRELEAALASLKAAAVADEPNPVKIDWSC